MPPLNCLCADKLSENSVMTDKEKHYYQKMKQTQETTLGLKIEMKLQTFFKLYLLNLHYSSSNLHILANRDLQSSLPLT